jgi:hypothetical protein
MNLSLNKGTIPELISLFRPTNDARPILLLGAGASFHSGIPLAADAVVRIVKANFAKVKLGYDWRFHDKVTTSDWKPYLMEQTWFQQYKENIAEAFPDAVKYLLTPQDFRKAFILDMVRPKLEISNGYKALADVVHRQLCWTVLTTNFDTLIADSFRNNQPYIKGIVEINKTASELVAYDDNNRCQIVYLHGAVEYYTDRIVAEETQQLDNRLIQNLRSSLRDAPLIVSQLLGQLITDHGLDTTPGPNVIFAAIS